MNNATTLDPIDELQPSPYTGSITTANIVRKSLLEKFNKEIADNWTPSLTRTWANWHQNGYQVKPGEKAIRSFTIINSKNKDGQTRKYKKSVCLFHFIQCQKI